MTDIDCGSTKSFSLINDNRPDMRREGATDGVCSVAPFSFSCTMIQVDDSDLDEDDPEFLTRWAEALAVSAGVLVLASIT